MEKRDPDAGEPPNIWIQWKGTELCADFRCRCGQRGHIDDGFCYAIRCESCGQVYVLPRTVELIPNEDSTDVYVEDDARTVTMDGTWR
jgi:hypothetical protein